MSYKTTTFKYQDKEGREVITSRSILVFPNVKKLKNLGMTNTPDYNIMISDIEGNYIPLGGIWKQKSKKGKIYQRGALYKNAMVVVAEDEEALNSLLDSVYPKENFWS